MSTDWDFDTDTWKILDTYFKQDKILTRHQIDSFNDYVETIIPKIIENNKQIVIALDTTAKNTQYKFIVEFRNIYMGKPYIHENNDTIRPLLPSEARNRDLTYASQLFVDVEQRFETTTYDETTGKYTTVVESSKTENKIPFMKMPIMVQSKFCHLYKQTSSSLTEMGECKYDQGGYFIVNGKEKVIVSQERVAENRIYVWPHRSSQKSILEAVVKSTDDQRFYPIKSNIVKIMRFDPNRDGNYIYRLSVQCPKLPDIPIIIMMKALGITSDREIYDIFLSNISRNEEYATFLYPSFEFAYSKGVVNCYSATQYLLTEQKKIKPDASDIDQKFYLAEILEKELLPHLNTTSDVSINNRKKAYFIGQMCVKVLECYFGHRQPDDRDHYCNKRVDLTGSLLAQLFKMSFFKLRKEIWQQLLPDINKTKQMSISLRKRIQSCATDSKIKYGLSTGEWSVGRSVKSGIAQLMKRLSYMDGVSHTRRIRSPIESAGVKLITPRKLHSSQYGMTCPNETPEGQEIGIIKNLSLLTMITIHVNESAIRNKLNNLRKEFKTLKDIRECNVKNIFFSVKIYVNCDLTHIISDDDECKRLYDTLRICKRHNTIHPFTSIAWNISSLEMHIRTDGGRYIRPLYIVEDGKLLIQELYNRSQQFRDKINGVNGNVIKWSDLLMPQMDIEGESTLSNGAVIEYIDSYETENAMIAMTYKDLINMSNKNTTYMNCTHVEIHPIVMMGMISSMIPFSDHNQSPRNCYQCLWKEENILMADGTMKKIKDIKIGDKVISIDPITHEQKVSEVINQYVKPTDKEIVEVSTINGRKVICTKDHLILTQNGWKEAGLLTKTDSICVKPIKEHEILFIPIGMVKSHKNVEIADISVANEPHSFITGDGICVHNCSMGKQALGYYATNYNERLDTLAHILVYGQQQLVSCRTIKYSYIDHLPHGVNAQLLYGCFTGYNQEDSVILNKSSVQRGFANTLYFRTYTDIAKKHPVLSEFKKPPSNAREKRTTEKYDPYHAIDENGLPRRGEYVYPNDVIIGKVTTITEKIIDQQTGMEVEKKIVKDASTLVKVNEEGYIDIVIPTIDQTYPNTNTDGNEIRKVRMVTYREPELGDKFASRSAQKGTCGMLYRGTDMPFNQYGETPDIIFNPHGVPTRMTCGKLLETLVGKCAVYEAKYQDSTPFQNISVEKFQQILEKFDMNTFGYDQFYNGQTGEQYNCFNFYGPTYYQRLKHMVIDKIHCLKGDHEVLTSSGWKFIPDITIDDYVATLKDGKLVYEKPTNVLHYPNYSGKMYSIKNQQIDLDVTINHRMWVSFLYGRKQTWQPYKLVKAEEIEGKYVKYQKNAEWDSPDYQFVLPAVDNISEKILDMDAWITFFGIWITEGWTTNDNCVQICQCKKRVRDIVIDAITKLGYDKSFNDDKITICDKQLWIYMSQYNNKYLPEWVWKLSQKQCQRLIYCMQLGDGSDESSMYYTSSVKLSDDFMRLCLHAGWSANKIKHLEKWQLNVITNNPVVNHEKQKVQEENIYEYTGDVYCLQVPSEVFYVRHNGKPVWTGNSRETGKIQFITRQPAEGRASDGGFRLGEMERDSLIAHGSAKFLKECFMDLSDAFKVYISKKDGCIIAGNPEQGRYILNGKSLTQDEVAEVHLPYAMKLLIQEITSMGILMKLHVEK